MVRPVRWLGLIAGCVLVTGVAFAAGAPEDCDNGIDDDLDFAVDCADSDCTSDSACDFGSGCCIIHACNPHAMEGGGAGGRPPAEMTVSCFEDLSQSECEARFSGAMDLGGGGATIAECPALELLEGVCSAQAACPAFGIGPVPALSPTGMMALALLLAAGGAFYLRRARS